MIKNHLKSYPITHTTIQLSDREIQLTIVDDPDRFLDKLSREDSEGWLFLPYWIYLWESAIGLARHISELDRPLSDKRVLEIGCGFGLAGITACQAGAKVVFTDFEHDALLFARHNVEQNGIDSAIFVQMDWNALCFQDKFDIILASDVIYEEQNWEPILSSLQNLLSPDGVAFFSEPNRKNADGFFKCLRDNGFTYQKSTCSISEDGKTIQVNIYKVEHVYSKF
ncbi:MAG: methyltransferase domain-containing protein [Candidatus Poribacteria bacterium]|nr:methyltransferase domain-containing protein [Candidatus Poribacteria bacterium]